MKAVIMNVVSTGKPVLIVKYEEGWNGKGVWIDIHGRRWNDGELTL
ncbi:hypothetical protein [Chryseobacterium sp. WX]|nr:hypothetical protein [Chryseobacterium sp. WX]WFB67047.1 hypothetical protein PZ898_20385 [Chryseobacterium sp. WX]